jgi:hypothetical protein
MHSSNVAPRFQDL